MYDIKWGNQKLENLDPGDKFDTMVKTIAVITKLAAQYDIKPIVVGGLSVEIYTNCDYSTRDIDCLAGKIDISKKILKDLGFSNQGSRHYFRDDLKVAIDIMDLSSEGLAGSYDKVEKIDIDEELYVYVISREDIIMDRLRAFLYWADKDSKYWGMFILRAYIDDLDIEYMLTYGSETSKEIEELKNWLDFIKNIK